MVYLEKFVASIVSQKGIISEENVHSGDSTVFLPFGTDYGLKFKNLNTRLACVSITIDGKDVLDGSSLVVHPNSTVNLDGFMENGKVKTRFRFIQKTEQIKKHRGDKIDDGIIRIEWRYEQELLTFTLPYYPYVREKDPYIHKGYPYKKNPFDITEPWTHDNVPWWVTTPIGTYYSGSNTVTGSNINNDKNVKSCFNHNTVLRSSNCKTDKNTQVASGITVKGGDANQNFVTASVNQLESEKHVIIINLKGLLKNNQPVKQILSTKTKTQCSSCGKYHKSMVKFCSNCGTRLEK